MQCISHTKIVILDLLLIFSFGNPAPKKIGFYGGEDINNIMNHEKTELWVGDIKYGNYSRTQWFSVEGWKNSLFQMNLKNVKSKPELFQGYDLVVTGGLLEDWMSWDVDWVLCGPYNPSKIIEAINWIVLCGFDCGLYPDVNYCDFHISISELQSLNLSYCGTIYELSNDFTRNGVSKMIEYEKIDGLYKRNVCYPRSTKELIKFKKGYVYKRPLTIFSFRDSEERNEANIRFSHLLRPLEISH